MALNVTMPPLHSNRVKAWVYGVVNPLVESLRREIFLLGEGNLSWRAYSKKCEYIRPLPEYVGSAQRPNYEDFVEDLQNPGFKEGFGGHDTQVAELESDATRFFDSLTQSEEFSAMVEKSLKRYKEDARANPLYPSLDSIGERLPAYIAQDVINRTDVLPHHYVSHKLWEDFKHEFQTFQKGQTFQALIQTSGALMDTSKKLLHDLENHRRFLCTTYDIPAAPILADKSHSQDAFVV